jgi:hypothetical protein
MTRHDPEIEELREKVHCAVVLERTPPCWARLVGSNERR